MRKYAFILAFILTVMVPTHPSASRHAEYLECWMQDKMELELWKAQQDSIERAKELERYTEWHKNLGILHNYNVDIDNYLEVMAEKESSDNYKEENQYGFIGKYQFGKKTLLGLRRIGFLKFDRVDIQKENFLENELLQEAAMNALTAHNAEVLTNYGLLKFLGKNVGGVNITIEGMLAASHLRGPFAVYEYMKTNGVTNRTDGNGTSVKDYITAFS